MATAEAIIENSKSIIVTALKSEAARGLIFNDDFNKALKDGEEGIKNHLRSKMKENVSIFPPLAAAQAASKAGSTAVAGVALVGSMTGLTKTKPGDIKDPFNELFNKVFDGLYESTIKTTVKEITDEIFPNGVPGTEQPVQPNTEQTVQLATGPTVEDLESEAKKAKLMAEIAEAKAKEAKATTEQTGTGYDYDNFDDLDCEDLSKYVVGGAPSIAEMEAELAGLNNQTPAPVAPAPVAPAPVAPVPVVPAPVAPAPVVPAPVVMTQQETKSQPNPGQPELPPVKSGDVSEDRIWKWNGTKWVKRLWFERNPIKTVIIALVLVGLAVAAYFIAEMVSNPGSFIGGMMTGLMDAGGEVLGMGVDLTKGAVVGGVGIVKDVGGGIGKDKNVKKVMTSKPAKSAKKGLKKIF